MNTEKPKLMTNSTEILVSVKGVPIQYCTEYIYLGQTISMLEHWDKVLWRRIGQSWGKFWSLKIYNSDQCHPPQPKFQILQSSVLPVLTYSSQTWSLTIDQIKKIQICQRKISLKDKITKVDIRKRSNMEDLTSIAQQLKWKWDGHVARMHQERWAYATTV